MKVAVVHEWLVNFAGSEQVLEQMLAVYPSADLFAVADFLPPADRARLGSRVIRTTFLQRLPWARTRYRGYLPLAPFAIETLDVTGYDVVISSSHAVAKGVITGPDQLHLCMCYSPIRYAWDLQHQYLRQSKLDHGIRGMLAYWVLHRMRIWDVRTANGVDEFIAISRFVARRIRKAYGRTSAVIYPPVDTEGFSLGDGGRDDFYLTASRLVSYKRVDAIVEAFKMLPDHRLVVIGDGPEMRRLRALGGPNVTFLGHCSKPELRTRLQRARAFVFAAEEDFGIVALEAQACGTPVLAYGRGGSLETVRGGRPGCSEPADPTGLFFDEQSPECIAAAVRAFEQDPCRFTPAACRRQAEAFGVERFRREFQSFVEDRWRTFRQQLAR